MDKGFAQRRVPKARGFYDLERFDRLKIPE